MKWIKLLTGVLIFTGISNISAQDSLINLSLKQACQMGIERNTSLKNEGLEQQKIQWKLKEAQSQLYPQIEGYSTFNYYYAIPKMIVPGEIFGQSGLIPIEIGTKFDWSSGFKASQVLYNQSYFSSLKLSQQLLSMEGLTLQQKKEEVVYQVTQLYYLCLATCEQASLLENTMQNTDTLLAIANLQRQSGVMRNVDYSRVKVNKDNLQTQIDNLNQLYDQQLGMLKFVMGVASATEVNLTDSLSYSALPGSVDEPDFSNRTELQLLDRQIEMTLINRKAEQQSYLPTLSGFGQYYYQGQRNEFDFFKGENDKFFKVGFVGLNLNIPIFDGFEKHTKIQQHTIELLQLQNTRKNTADFFTKEYSDARMQYTNSMKALLRQKESIKVAEETYAISLQGYRQQVVTMSDLLMSENSLIEARLSYANALLQLNNAELELKKAKGELLTNE